MAVLLAAVVEESTLAARLVPHLAAVVVESEMGAGDDGGGSYGPPSSVDDTPTAPPDPSSPCSVDNSDPVSARISPDTVSLAHGGASQAFRLYVQFADTGATEFEITGCSIYTTFTNDSPLTGDSLVGNVYVTGSGTGTNSITGLFTKDSVSVTASATITVT
jgi:hypothetical protein